MKLSMTGQTDLNRLAKAEGLLSRLALATRKAGEKKCKVCDETVAHFFYADHRSFYKCPTCSLIFTKDYPPKDKENGHYQTQWEETQPEFWEKQVDVLLQMTQNYFQPQNILDFGAGSGHLTRELQRRGYAVTPLEPMVNGYLKDQDYPHTFDLIIALEVVEHLHDLWSEFQEIDKVLSPGGIFLCSTALSNPFIEQNDAVQKFSEWWYKDDFTHVNFFCNATLARLGERMNWDVDIYANKAFVMIKPPIQPHTDILKQP